MSILIYLLALSVIYAAWAMTIKKGLHSLRCTRSFSRPAFYEGEEGELIEVMRNDKPYFIPWLRLESRISPYLRLGKQDNLHVSGEMYYCSVFTLMPYQQIRRTHHVRFLRRGSYDLGNASMTAGDLLGIRQFQLAQTLRVPVLVYPRLLSRSEIPLPMSLMLGELSRRSQLLKDPFLIKGIRAYQPGDPVRDIHWPATARMGDVQVRLHDDTARTKLLVVLNAQPDDAQLKNQIPEKDIPTLEYGISLAATLCVQALQSGLSVGFAANMPLDDGSESTILLPAEGAAREEALLAAFARLRVIRSDPFPRLLESLTAHGDLDILILSTYDSSSLQEARQRLLRRGNQVSFHLFKGGDDK